MTPDVLRELTPPGQWFGSWPPIAVLGVAFLALVGTALRARAARRRRLTALAVAAVLLVPGAAGVANLLTGYVPTPGAARLILTGRLPGLAGTLLQRRLGAPDLGVPTADTYVYLPPGYSPGASRRYPVVYLFHGTPGRATDWFAAGDAARTLDVLIAHRLIPPMIAVAPDLNGGGLHDTECLNDPAGHRQLETYLTTRLIPWTDAHFDTDPRPAARIAAGMSAGAFCALDQGLRHRDVYGPIIAVLPFGDPGPDWRDKLTPAQFAAVSPRTYLPTIALPAPVPVFLGTGARTAASELDGLAELQTELAARGSPLLRHDVPDDRHSWRTARLCLPYGLVFAARYLPAPSG